MLVYSVRNKYSGRQFPCKFKVLKITFSKFSFLIHKEKDLISMILKKFPENVGLELSFCRIMICKES
jgi:hypothetical protein